MAGYSGTPLVKKLGIKAGHRVKFVGEPAGFRALLEEMPKTGRSDGKAYDYIHVFVRKQSELEAAISAAKKLLEKDGMLWMSWPKKASKAPTDVTEDVIRAAALKLGLVDVKVCAVDDTWSGLKLVYRTEDRGSAAGK